MPSGLRRFQESAQAHFVTFSCYQRRPYLTSSSLCDQFLQALEDMRARFQMRVYGYVVMPEHVHLLLSEPPRASTAQVSAIKPREPGAPPGFLLAQVSAIRPREPGAPGTPARLADAIHYLKLSYAKRVHLGVFWQKRYYDRNVRDYREFTIKLRYLHRNPVKRGLVNDPADWKWSSFRHYALREIGIVEIESEWTARDRETQVPYGSPRVFLGHPG